MSLLAACLPGSYYSRIEQEARATYLLTPSIRRLAGHLATDGRERCGSINNTKDRCQEMDARQTFLLSMYSEAWRNIERHILVVWQTAGVVGATFAVLLFAAESKVPFDLAISVELLVIGWLYAHILDAEFWFKRNLHIITNIEREFLSPSDAADIHFYFLPRRDGTRTPSLDHLTIQKQLARGLFLSVLAFHACSAIARPQGAFLLPYFVAGGIVVALGHFKTDRAQKHAELEARSPGRKIL